MYCCLNDRFCLLRIYFFLLAFFPCFFLFSLFFSLRFGERYRRGINWFLFTIFIVILSDMAVSFVQYNQVKAKTDVFAGASLR